ncbi:hypothetical protein CRYUN_Cryun13aG0042200 [Craigia yunnanensis]
MEGVFAIIFIFSNLLLLPYPSSSFPLCINSRAPLTLNTALKFCSYNGSSCCNSTEDSQLQKQFQAMNISDPSCASVLQSVLCARCDPFSAKLFTIDSVPRPVPLLCNSTVSTNSSQSNQAINDFCSKVWDTCQNVSILNSPFASSLQGQAGAPSKTDFCNAFGVASTDGSVCYDGEPVTLNKTGTPSAPHGLCLEKIGNGSYLDMVAHPDGSNRAFFSNQKGKIWLATIPEVGSGGTLELDESNPFIDLTDEVHFDTTFGMMGIAFHPNFAQNGRFFASFNCDKGKSPGCTGRYSCNSDVNCDPSKLVTDNGAQPCQYQTVIAEYTANGTTSGPSLAENARSSEVSRIFTMGLPFTSQHGGQILFGPTDRCLSFISFDTQYVVPGAAEINRLGLWGNYSIPKDNPFSQDEELLPEIWAFGLRNPWRCSFDLERPSYFMCGDIGEDLYEEVDIISKGGNYGWRAYEGPYLYADLYSGAIWAATEDPENSGNFSTRTVPFGCARASPIQCSSTVPESALAALGYIFSFGQDNSKDIYLLTSSGVYRVVPPSRCNYTCSTENVTAVAGPSPTTSPPSHANQLISPVILLSALLLLLLSVA